MPRRSFLFHTLPPSIMRQAVIDYAALLEWTHWRPSSQERVSRIGQCSPVLRSPCQLQASASSRICSCEREQNDKLISRPARNDWGWQVAWISYTFVLEQVPTKISVSGHYNLSLMAHLELIVTLKEAAEVPPPNEHSGEEQHEWSVGAPRDTDGEST